MQEYEIIIVGAGPAGCATALELAKLDPSLAPRVLLLDKAIFPRVKLCAGGVTIHADIVLRHLGIDVDVMQPPSTSQSLCFPVAVSCLSSRIIFEWSDGINSMACCLDKPSSEK